MRPPRTLTRIMHASSRLLGLSMAHGLPFGKAVKYRTGTDEKVGEVELGLLPAAMQISAATGLLYVVNFNLHGSMEPSSVSVEGIGGEPGAVDVIDLQAMALVATVETGKQAGGIAFWTIEP